MTTHSQIIPNLSGNPYQSQVQQQYQNPPSQFSRNPAQSYGLGGGDYLSNASPQKNSQLFNAKHIEDEPPMIGESQSRISYLRRLYFAVFLQMALTALFTYFSETSLSFRNWVLNTTGVTFILCLIVTVVLSLAAFFQKASLSKPVLNLAVYIIYTLAFATLFAYLDAKYSPLIHYFFLFMAYLFAGLFFHALLCFGPITFQNAALFILGSVLGISLKLEIFSELPLKTISVFAVIVVALGFFIVWENETVISGAKTEWSREDPIIGSIGFFLNLFTLFLRFATLVSKIAIGSK